MSTFYNRLPQRSDVEMKAILVAGGHGSRLHPFTQYTQKTLLPLHQRPVIDYALATIRRAGITDITIIANQFVDQIAKHVGQGLPDENIHYVIEETPKGVAHALRLAQAHNENVRLMVYFSDNITSMELGEAVAGFKHATTPPGCVLLAREEANPHAFGVAVLDDEGNVVDVVEKPEDPPSNLAIGGIYLFDEAFWTHLDAAVDAAGEAFSISDVTRRYVRAGRVHMLTVGEATWVDCGDPSSLLQASIMASKGVFNPHPHRN